MSTLEMVAPRICTYPDYDGTSGDEAVELAAMAGLELDEWQKFVLVHALGERVDGRWAAPTVGLVVGRQNGKNAVLEARQLAGLFLLNEQVIVHSAHDQVTSSEHFRRLLARIESVPEFDKRVHKVSHGKGAEAIELTNRQRILFKTRTGGGGRGFSVDLIVFDEAMILSAGAKAALIPTLAARSMDGNTQIWYAGSAVDQLNPAHDGIELARVREKGIAEADRIAYFEWSAPGDDPDAVDDETASDPDIQALANPGMGIRISREWIEHERTVELGRREFVVERLGIGDWPRTDGLTGQTMISPDEWAGLVDEDSVLTDPVVLAFDVSPDRLRSSIAAAGFNAEGKLHVEVGEARNGTGWLTERIAELAASRNPSAIVCDGYGPAASFVPELEDDVQVVTVSAGEYGQACGQFVDRVLNGEIVHLGSGELGAAVAGAKTRPLGDAWAWSRKNSAVDISPLVAVTLAAWLARDESDSVMVW